MKIMTLRECSLVALGILGLAPSALSQSNTIHVHLNSWVIDTENIPENATVEEDEGFWPFWSWEATASAGAVDVVHDCELWDDGAFAGETNSEVFLSHASQRSYDYQSSPDHPWGKAKEVLTKKLVGNADVYDGNPIGSASAGLWIQSKLAVTTTIGVTEVELKIARSMTTSTSSWKDHLVAVLVDRLGLTQAEAELLAGPVGQVTNGQWHGNWSQNEAFQVKEQGQIEEYDLDTDSKFRWIGMADGGLASATVKSDGTLQIYGDVYLDPDSEEY